MLAFGFAAFITPTLAKSSLVSALQSVSPEPLGRGAATLTDVPAQAIIVQKTTPRRKRPRKLILVSKAVRSAIKFEFHLVGRRETQRFIDLTAGGRGA